MSKVSTNHNEELSLDVLLHFGFHKTGSSSIQETLARLEQPGLRYLQRDPANHSQLIRGGYSAIQADAAPRPPRLRFRKLLAQAATKPEARRLIVSGEATVHLDDAGMMCLRDDLFAVAENVRLIGYIRPVSSYMSSAFQEIIKHRFIDFNRSKAPLYRDSVRRMDGAFGRNSVEILPFDKKALDEGDVVVDFCRRIGVTVKSDQIVRTNESISLEAASLLYIHRKRYPEASSGRATIDRPFIALLRKAGTSRFQFHGAFVRERIEPYIDDMRQVCHRVGFDEETFLYTDHGGIRSEEDLVGVALDPDFQRSVLPEITGQKVSRPLGAEELADLLEATRKRLLFGNRRGWLARAVSKLRYPFFSR